jgi:hypothetical protein
MTRDACKCGGRSFGMPKLRRVEQYVHVLGLISRWAKHDMTRNARVSLVLLELQRQQAARELQSLKSCLMYLAEPST